jgi:tetraacyldisaccharide 4'-kinase
MVRGKDGQFPLLELKQERVTLVTGIADPRALLEHLSTTGIEVDHLQYGDHHFFTEREVEFFNTKKLILTTEKDYTRLQGKVNNLYFLGIKHEFLSEGKTALFRSISSFTKPCR